MSFPDAAYRILDHVGLLSSLVMAKTLNIFAIALMPGSTMASRVITWRKLIGFEIEDLSSDRPCACSSQMRLMVKLTGRRSVQSSSALAAIFWPGITVSG